MIAWTQDRSVDGRKVETSLTLAAWSAAWLAALGSFGSFVVNLTRAFGLWH